MFVVQSQFHLGIMSQTFFQLHIPKFLKFPAWGGENCKVTTSTREAIKAKEGTKSRTYGSGDYKFSEGKIKKKIK